MNSLFEDEIRGHHSIARPPVDRGVRCRSRLKAARTELHAGRTAGGTGRHRGHLFTFLRDFTLDWAHREISPPAPITIASLQLWFAAQDDALDSALSRFTEDELHIDRIDRGHGFIASPFVQHQIYREAVYIFYGKLSVYLKALERDAGQQWAMWVG